MHLVTWHAIPFPTNALFKDIFPSLFPFTLHILDRKKYATIHCTGYLKSWPPGKVGLDKDEMEVDIDGCNLSCLVAVARVQVNSY